MLISSIMRKLLVILFFISSSNYLLAQRKMTANQYVERYKMIALYNRFEYKIPASITLAQGILESGLGGSYLAIEANNHFGIKCHSDWRGKRIYKDDDAKDECFRVYKNADDSYKDHALFLTGKSRYAFLFSYKITDYKKWAKGLKKAGYATNPKYPKRLIDIIEKYRLAKYDKISRAEYDKMLGIVPVVIVDADTAKTDTLIITNAIVENNKSNNSNVHAILYHNRIRSIIVHNYESIMDIANKFDISPKRIYKYNDLAYGTSLTAGMRLYLQPKRRKGDVKYHIVKKGETLWSISQMHGIKLKWLKKRNLISSDSELKKGVKLNLRKTKTIN